MLHLLLPNPPSPAGNLIGMMPPTEARRNYQISQDTIGARLPVKDAPARLCGARVGGFPKDRVKKVQRCADKPRVYAKRSEEKACEASRRPLRI
jgi:hypothetical protein